MKIFTNPMNFCRLYLSGEGFIGLVVNAWSSLVDGGEGLNLPKW